MFGRRYCDWNFYEMNQTPIVILIALFIASANIQNISVVANEEQQADQQLEPIRKYAVIGSNFTVLCETESNVPFKWNKDGVNIAESNKRFHLRLDNNELPRQKYSLTIRKVEANDTGIYTCEQFGPIDGGAEPKKKRFSVAAVIQPRIVAKSAERIEPRIGDSVLLFCVIEAHPLADFEKTIKWVKDDANSIDKRPMATSHFDQVFVANRSKINRLNEQRVNITLDLANITKKDTGRYSCIVEVPYDDDDDQVFDNSRLVSGSSAVFVLHAPQVNFETVEAVGATEIFVNWTTNNGNSPITKYTVQYMKEGEPTYLYYKERLNGNKTSHVLENFQPNTTYYLKIMATNKIGLDSPVYDHKTPVTTLAVDPVFVPVIEVKGMTTETITIGWHPPSAHLLQYIQYYELTVALKANESKIIEEAVHPQNSRNLPYMFDNLKAGTEYIFRVRACNELTKKCGNWSASVTGATSDGTASIPTNLKVHCNVTDRTVISVQWNAPLQRNGVIVSYNLELNGVASYRSEKNHALRNDTYGPKSKVALAPQTKAEFENVPFNTEFTVKVSAITRSRKPGAVATAKCSTPRYIPDWKPILWGSARSDGKYLIKVYMPELSERNGPICGYRIYLVRMPEYLGLESYKLPDIKKLNISTYHEVHAETNYRGGVYIAETLSTETIHREVILGDGNNNNDGFQGVQNAECRRLLRGFVPPSKRSSAANSIGLMKTTTTTKPLIDDEPDEPDEPDEKEPEDPKPSEIPKTRKRRFDRLVRREVSTNAIEVENPETGKATTTAPRAEESIQIVDGNNAENIVYDGPLDSESIYSGYIEVIVNKDDKSEVLTTYSEYMDPLNMSTAIDSVQEENLSKILSILTQVLCGLILLVLVLLTTLCVMHRVNSTKQQGNDVISLRDSLSRAFCGGRNNQSRRHLLGTTVQKPTDIGPIHRDDLLQAYIMRHKDTDYGFLREYEMLPNRFNDRTTKNSDAKENAGKNRYPDIKAYDQTRVKLSERLTNGMTCGTDYINANFVIGYKERKKFICAQGPMDSTVNDFWRMIWEQHLEIIVMLTNLEEYNKAKCAKYWPEQINDTQKFGEITVAFTHEQRYTDYLVRELKITRSHSAHNNVNSNGNGGLSNGSVSGDEEEERHITQYHYLVWKDFMAPELGVIRFIRQINDVYSLQRGPILIHCSAGVGRTGTLVALDSLMQQLQDENQVSIFNTVYDMRHQRNFLVQSLKQYIFLYRALLDVAQFGNTEIQLKDLNSTVEQLKQRSNDSRDQCKLEIEFERLNSVLDETNKSCAVGASEENRNKNRSDSVIPYDRNRVILTPIGPQPSTYINATFMEGYDNSESFIITQDPLEETIGDFWRMLSEQSISTIVMISEIGDGPRKCPRYWADDEVEYDHILVKYMQSESCPYYTRREFNVTNFKIKDTIKVTQFQYNGWPTVEGEVPEVTRGMLELVDQTLALHENPTYVSSPIVVHCSLGTDRSSIFVTLCILVQQLRLEKKVDVCTVVRKLRSQRSQFLSTYAQYEFVYRAIANYADLHKSDLDSSPSPSVKTNS
ncbi:tyrosine-protein phosphatase 69D isoform X2 [Sitodiplosis mosellana]|uniref:tyrosine-protein phosphatase 69D isoform X2 n=1 Tax=Sitodiplosis mosellana TaxID=263140 RepID=UPI002443A16C|nr:tyrosine-protein phosphatase 69D isoform X2 [Sitodiplosis mosellana]